MEAQTKVQDTLEIYKGRYDVKDVKLMIEGTREERGSCFDMLAPWAAVMQVADSNGDWQGQVIERALKGQFVSEKQAWCVAFYFKSMGLAK